MRQFLWIAGSALAFWGAACAAALLIAGLGSQAFGDWRLVFLRWNVASEFWVISVGCGLCVAAIFTLFRYELQLIPRGLGVTLLLLRITLVGILFLTLLEPVWTWSHDQTRTGRVLIALDVSESMDTLDPQASEGEKIRWAQALGMLGSADLKARTRDWIAALAEGREPEWVSAEDVADPEKRARLAKVRKENLHAQLSEVSQFSRLELARRALNPPAAPPIADLKSLAVVQWAAFGQRFAMLDEKQFAAPLEPGRLDVGREHSDLLQAAEAARTGSAEASLAAVVLVSDGHDTDSPRPAELVSRLQGLGVPVHTVLVGSEHRPRDLSIIHVEHPDSVFIKDQPQIKAILQTSGFEGTPVTVRLERLDVQDAEPQTQTLTPHAPSAEVAFTLDPLEKGRHRFRLRIDPIAGETRDDNNGSEFSISVVDDRAKALVIDGDARWEFRFLKDALARDERISLDVVLFEQPFLGVLRKTFFPSRIEDLSLETPPQGTPFAQYDVILLGDISPTQLSTQRWQQLDRYVREEGGTLVLTAGRRFFPLAYSGTLAEALLPVERLRIVRADDASLQGPPPRRGFQLGVTLEGEQLPMFQLDADPARARRVWGELPGHDWGIVGEARGGASVWATPARQAGAGSVEVQRQQALIAQHYVGAGQVVWIGIDSTWRWRYLVGDLYHHRFWGQLVRWAVSFKATAGNDVVRLGLAESVIRAGQPARVQARWDERFAAQHPGLKSQAILERTGAGPRTTQTIDLAPRGSNPLIHEGQALNLPPGEYTVRLKIVGAPPAQELPEALLVVNAELTAELQDVSANRPLLEQIAHETGGEFLYLNELDKLPPLFQNIQETHSIREEVPLYGHWLILVLFSTVAMTEWVLRKLNGLP